METFLNFPSTLQSSTNIKYFEREYSSICYLSHTIFIDADILVLVFLFSVVLYSFFLIIIYTYSHCFLGSFLSLTLSLWLYFVSAYYNHPIFFFPLSGTFFMMVDKFSNGVDFTVMQHASGWSVLEHLCYILPDVLLVCNCSKIYRLL